MTNKDEIKKYASLPDEIGEQIIDSVNILTVERGLIHFFEGLRILPEYEKIRYGVLQPDEVGVALSLSDSTFSRGRERIRFEFVLWGRSIQYENFRSRFGKLPKKLPEKGTLIPLPGGSRLVFTRLAAPLGALFETEYLFGLRVVNGILFLEAELNVQESAFHMDDAPKLEDLVIADRQLPLLALERSTESYLRHRLKTPLEVELDSLLPLRRRGGAELRLRVSSDSCQPEELVERFPIIRPEFPDPSEAPSAILPDAVTRDYVRLLCIY